MVWNVAECKCALEALLAGVSTKRAAEQPMHLNRKETQTNRRNTLRNFSLHGFSKHLHWFRCQPGLEHRRTQMRPEGTSDRGIHQTRSRTPHASEPEQNSKNQPQFIEKLFIAGFQQASPPVQMQRKRGASEPCGKAESGSQSAHNKHIAGLSATVPVVQIPAGSGKPQYVNVTWRYFWQGYPPNAQQSGPSI